MNDTAKTSGSQDLVKIRPAVAEQSRLYTERLLEYTTSPSFTASGAVCLYMLVLERVVQYTQSHIVKLLYMCVISVGKQV